MRFLGDGFVFDPVWGMFHRVSPTAALLLRALDEGTKPRDLPALLVARYGIDQARAARDAERFMQELRALGLVTA